MLDLRRYLNAAYFFLIEMTRRPEQTLGAAVDEIEKALAASQQPTEEQNAKANAEAMRQLGMMIGSAQPA